MKIKLFFFIGILYLVVAASCNENYSYKNLDTNLADIQYVQVEINDVAIPIDSITIHSDPVYHNALIDGIWTYPFNMDAELN
ncbi:MAG: hypothetical protein ACOCU3_01110 [bacterium]